LEADGEVFCDQGEDALWEDARDRYNDLKTRHTNAAAAVAELRDEENTGYNALNTAWLTA
jgi:hypothetical protein